MVYLFLMFVYSHYVCFLFVAKITNSILVKTQVNQEFCKNKQFVETSFNLLILFSNPVTTVEKVDLKTRTLLVIVNSHLVYLNICI